MRKFLFAIYFLLLTAISSGAVLAQGDLPKEDRLKLRQQEQSQTKEAVGERVATKQAGLRANHILRLKEVFSKIVARLNAAVARLDKISEKIENRINKLEEAGVNVSVAKNQLAGCDSKKTAAVNAISQAQAEISAIDENSSTVRETVQKSVRAIKSAKQAVREYHKCLLDVVKTLKALRPREATQSGN